MVLFVFKIIFLIVFVIGGLIMLCAPLFYPAIKVTDEKIRVRKITKLKLIGVIVAGVGLLVVIILSNF